MKGGLGNTALAQPEIILTRQQAVAEEQPQLSVERTLVIVARVVLQDVTNVVWIRDQVTAPGTDLEVGDITESASGLHEDADRIASDGREHAKDRHSPRSRRQRVCGMGRLFHSHQTTIARDLSARIISNSYWYPERLEGETRWLPPLIKRRPI